MAETILYNFLSAPNTIKLNSSNSHILIGGDSGIITS
jgi:hypothetical protein